MSPEKTRELHESLSDLLGRLRAEDEQSDETVRELEQLHNELGQLLEQRDATPAPIAGRLRNTLERFEAKHPRTALLVGRIAESLSEMGL